MKQIRPCAVRLLAICILLGMVLLTGCATVSPDLVENSLSQSQVYPPVVLTPDAQTAIETLAKRVNLQNALNFGIGSKDINPQIITDGIRNVLAQKFPQKGNASRGHLVLLLDVHFKLAWHSGAITTLEMVGIFKDGGRTVETVIGEGSGMMPYPAFSYGFQKAADAAFAQLSQNINSSQALAMYRSGRHAGGSLVASYGAQPAAAAKRKPKKIYTPPPRPVPPSQPAIVGPASPIQAQRLLDQPLEQAATGIYTLDNDHTFNVLDSVYYDPTNNQLSLVGHFDKHFAGPRIPYLQYLATLMENPRPEFSLTWTPDSEQQVDALFNQHLSSAEGEQITDAWGQLFDAQGNITEAGRLLLPEFGLSPIEGNRAPGAMGLQVSPEANSTAVLVSSVDPGSPASQAGLQVGDLILSMGGTALFSPDEFYHEVRMSGAGATVSYIYLHNTGSQLMRYSGQATLTADSDPDVWKDANSADLLRALYLANGDQHAADVMKVAEIMIRNTSLSPEGATELRGLMIDTLGLRDTVNADMAAVNNNTMTQVNAFYDVYSKECEGFDEALHFNGTPVKNAYVSAYQQQGGGDPNNAIPPAMQELSRQLTPKLEGMLDPIFTRPEGLQIPPELVQKQFHVRLEMIPQYLGVPKDSLLAREMFDGDYLCKRLLNRTDLKKSIPGYETSFEFEVAHPQLRHSTGNYRVWISVDKMDTPQSPDGHTLAFRDVRMRFNIRDQGSGGDLPPQPGSYEELLTSLWGEFEQQFPTLHELRESAKLAAAAKWILQQNPSAALPMAGRNEWQGPEQVPGLIYVEMAPDPVLGINKTRTTFIAEGGVSLTPFPQTGINNPNLNGQAGANPFPYDTSVVDLSGMGSAPLDTLSPTLFTHQEQYSLASQIFHQTITVPDLHPAGWVKQFNKGRDTYDSISVQLDQLTGVPPQFVEQSIELREKLEQIREVARQLALTERAINVLNNKNAGQAAEFQNLQKEITEDRNDFIEHAVDFAADNMLEARTELKNHSTIAGAGEFANDFKEDADFFEGLKTSIKSGSAPLASLEAGAAYIKKFSGELTAISQELGAGTAAEYFQTVTHAQKFEDVLWVETDFAKLNFITDPKVDELEKSSDATRAALKDKLLPLEKEQSDELDTLCNDPQIQAFRTPPPL